MHSLNDYQQQHQAPDSNHLPGQPIQALHYAYRPNSVIPVEDPGSPSYPTYFSPLATTTSVPHRHRQSDHLHVARNNGRYANEKLHMRSHAVQHHPNTQPFNLRRQRNPHSPTYIYYPQERYYPPRLYYPLPHQLHHYPSYPAYSSYHVPSVQTKVNVPPPLPPRDSPYLYRPQELKPVSDPYYQHARAMQSKNFLLQRTFNFRIVPKYFRLLSDILQFNSKSNLSLYSLYCVKACNKFARLVFASLRLGNASSFGEMSQRL